MLIFRCHFFLVFVVGGFKYLQGKLRMRFTGYFENLFMHLSELSYQILRNLEIIRSVTIDIYGFSLNGRFKERRVTGTHTWTDFRQ